MHLSQSFPRSPHLAQYLAALAAAFCASGQLRFNILALSLLLPNLQHNPLPFPLPCHPWAKTNIRYQFHKLPGQEQQSRAPPCPGAQGHPSLRCTRPSPQTKHPHEHEPPSQHGNFRRFSAITAGFGAAHEPFLLGARDGFHKVDDLSSAHTPSPLHCGKICTTLSMEIEMQKSKSAFSQLLALTFDGKSCNWDEPSPESTVGCAAWEGATPEPVGNAWLLPHCFKSVKQHVYTASASTTSLQISVGASKSRPQSP